MIPVRVDDGLVVMHTLEEYARFMRGVDAEAARAMCEPLRFDDEPVPPVARP
jgi:hypothetical protein